MDTLTGNRSCDVHVGLCRAVGLRLCGNWASEFCHDIEEGPCVGVGGVFPMVGCLRSRLEVG